MTRAKGATAVGSTPDLDPDSGTRPRRGPLRVLAAFVRELVIVVGLALVLFLVAKTFLIGSFWIPSNSMNDTLLRDDRVMVSKLTPGPFELSRGDVVVFEDPAHWLRGGVPAPLRSDEGWRGEVSDFLSWVGVLPDDQGNHLVKRVIGLPGDKVACCDRNGRLTVNGVSVKETYVRESDPPSQITFSITVPQGRVWVMGDHRSDSADSRYNDTADVAFDVSSPQNETDPLNHTGYYGSVPIERIVGKAFVVVWPFARWYWLGTPSDVYAQVPAPVSAPSSPPSPGVTPPASASAPS